MDKPLASLVAYDRATRAITTVRDGRLIAPVFHLNDKTMQTMFTPQAHQNIVHPLKSKEIKCQSQSKL